MDPTALTKGSGLTLVFAALVGAIIWNPEHEAQKASRHPAPAAA